MPLPIYRLRRLLGLTAVVLTAMVLGMYFYARMRVRDVRKEVPGKLGYEISKTAHGFRISKSDGKRTLFTVEAGEVKEFKLNDRAELHNVNIILYGRDSSRYDQVYGDDFAYDPRTGEVTAQGDVQIDLVGNPSGLQSADQSVPKELKNPIHLKTRDLVFNRDTGNATTDAKVEFSTPQASGWAVGVKYAGKSNTLTLVSQIHIALSGARAAVIEAERGVMTGDPREIVLARAHLDRERGRVDADQAVFYLDSDNSLQRVVAMGNVTAQTRPAAEKGSAADPPAETRVRAHQADFLLSDRQNLLRTATLTGNVHIEQSGPEPIAGDAGRVVLDFGGRNEVKKVHALDGARLVQKAEETKKAGTSSTAQDFELTAPQIDFTVRPGNILERAMTQGDARITITPAQEPAAPSTQTGQKTVVTAGSFEGIFAAGKRKNHLSSIHGFPNARVVYSSPGVPDRVSESGAGAVVCGPDGGVVAVDQGNGVHYDDGLPPDKRTQAWASIAHYTPADQMLKLIGTPSVQIGSMLTRANTIRINRATGEAVAEGDVKTTYSDVKEQPNGALLASASPIHVTAQRMTSQKTPGVALYSGKARLWQDANVIEAPSILFDRDRRSVTAHGTASDPVQTILVQAEKAQADKNKTSTGKNVPGTPTPAASSPIAITANQLAYADSERRAHYETGVLAKGADFSASAKTMDVYLVPRSQTASQPQNRQPVMGSFSGPGQLDRMVALGDVVIQQPNRRAEGQKLVYTASEDKFVLTGGPPSIFDAERGKITGGSLTFFRRDDRVLVEGEASSPVVTQTRVAH